MECKYIGRILMSIVLLSNIFVFSVPDNSNTLSLGEWPTR